MVQRITGLASGMDIDSVVKGMLTGQQMKVDKLTGKKQTIEWQRQAYLDMNTKLNEYRNNKLYNFKLEGTLAASKTSITGPEVISAKATGDAVPGNIVVKVKNMASAASANSSGSVVPVDMSKTNLNQQFGFSFGASDKITINGKTVTFDPATETLNTLISKINKETNVSAFFDTSTNKLSLMSKQTGLINGAAGTGDKIVVSGTLATAFKLDDDGTNHKAAKNAEVFINDLLTTQKNNTFRVNGVDITLNAESPYLGGVATNPNSYIGSTISISRDTDKIMESIKGFVNDYNEILKILQDKVGETRYRDFQPLTTEQKESMKDKEVERWEEKAKSGLLRNDSVLSPLISGMRLSISSKVDNGSKYNTLSSIGIKSTDYTDNGKLYITDESKLRKALEEEPQAVLDLFTANGSGRSDRSDMGIAERMYEDLNKAMDQIKKKTGLSSILLDETVLGKQMGTLSKQINRENSRLMDLETRYYKQFTAMEKAISMYNSQSTSLSGYFSK
ncbi:flagellar filament capping protein FliD [Paenibacillus silviterrae]|uniref:flagellar filament capping protein FliD n=1 Tax=Paenibacillus silviterrae TaxID=3242194 RepID=UPI0025437D3F|nr:flagellar filament capping protein FliD [Paenibacillus chinjuensis]